MPANHEDVAVVLMRDPTMAPLVRRFGRTAVGTREAFDALVRSVVSQQLSSKAADTICARLEARVGLDAPRLARTRGTALRACGLSRAKAACVKASARFALDGGLAGLPADDPDTVLGRLTAIKGVGPWTAHMVMIFALGVPDVWPTGDGGVRRALWQLYRTKSDRSVTRLGERFRPYRSYAACYLWRYLDA
jgi:DNA-3-methyladenine glycosylase II